MSLSYGISGACCSDKCGSAPAISVCLFSCRQSGTEGCCRHVSVVCLRLLYILCMVVGMTYGVGDQTLG